MADLLHKDRRGNPMLTGEVEDLFLLGFGVGLTGALNDNIFSPLTNSILNAATPGLAGADTGQKVLDAGTTWLTAMAEGHIGGMLGFTRSSRVVEKGGKALAIAKLASILLPGYSFNGKLPSFIQIPMIGGAPQLPPPKAGLTQMPGVAVTGIAMGVGSVGGPPSRPAVAGSAPGQRPTGL